MRNIATFRVMAQGHVQGKLDYPRWFVLWMSAVELGTFAAGYVIVAAVTRSAFAAGGAAMTAYLALQHWRNATKTKP